MSDRKKLTITVSGMAASGKSTLAESLAKHFKLKLYTGSDALRDFARKLGYTPKGKDWWDTEEGIKFLGERKHDYTFDKKTDDIMMDKAKNGGIVMTSWTLPYLGAPGIKIWINASRETRANRMMRRDGISVEEAEKVIDTRDRENTELYRKIYGFTIGRDVGKFYDMIIESDSMDEQQVFEKVAKMIEEKYL